MGRLICAVRYKGMDIRELLNHLVIYIIKCNAIMDIARGDLYCQNDTVNIAGGMCFIGQLLLVVTLDKQPAVWVGSAFYYCFCLLCFLFALFQFLPRGIVALLFGRSRWHIIILVILLILIIREWLFPMGFPVCVDLVHEFLCVPLCLNGHFFLYRLLEICVCLDMGSVHKHYAGSYVPGLYHFHEDPAEDPVYGFGCKTVTEVITNG